MNLTTFTCLLQGSGPTGALQGGGPTVACVRVCQSLMWHVHFVGADTAQQASLQHAGHQGGHMHVNESGCTLTLNESGAR